jgi:hypothetical protein
MVMKLGEPMKRLVNYFFITLATACFCPTVFAMTPMERLRNRTAEHCHDRRTARDTARRDGRDGRTSPQLRGQTQQSSHHQPSRVSRAMPSSPRSLASNAMPMAIAQPVTNSLDQFTDPGSFSASDFMSSFLEPSRVQTFSRGAKNCFLRGCIKMPCHQDMQTMPAFRILFDGKEAMSNQEGLYSFPADFAYLDSYALIICSEVVKHFDKANTLRNIGVIPDRPYRYFRLYKNRITNEWEMQEKRLYKENFIVPDHAVIFLTDPDMVDYIEPWDLSLPDNTVKLPVIFLKNMPTESLEKESARSLLSSLDQGSFHQDIREAKQEQPNKKIIATLPG